ncbi:class I SAM-dependent methyltransferase, partial [Rubripirellula amarantea]|uniref:Bifunctional 3-demethylubiquinone-9 3-methyltransferase/ 2-octaprenyl-6-hydroxy phenol methylase n=1 Tax=Rubripirellula amarantea TaxID=2527999 RepID=A0A5C5WRG3_9BACT|nr:class I SAM-dependent methyltransferase [Rubripirellula amarantea]MDA8744936.1 class I SAM-dependent methyltransferase [Rubripirellula amarantea]TWT53406.1 hypothetical protein Pla22_10350 [Rubripirellula amarantea]
MTDVEQPPYEYCGEELELFQHAIHWKETLRRQIEPYLGDHVLEVGAGIGGTTRVFHNQSRRRWTCLEPDPVLADQLRGSELDVEVELGTLESLTDQKKFDTILYIDVLEHIEQDAEELRLAARHLNPGGYLVVMSPAHPWLYSPFDKALGHFRRYTKQSLRAVAPASIDEHQMIYLDSVGMLASAANRIFLSQSHPTKKQILFWDRVLVRTSKWVDPLLFRQVGKSILAVWKCNQTGS